MKKTKKILLSLTAVATLCCFFCSSSLIRPNKKTTATALSSPVDWSSVENDDTFTKVGDFYYYPDTEVRYTAHIYVTNYDEFSYLNTPIFIDCQLDISTVINFRYKVYNNVVIDRNLEYFRLNTLYCEYKLKYYYEDINHVSGINKSGAFDISSSNGFYTWNTFTKLNLPQFYFFQSDYDNFSFTLKYGNYSINSNEFPLYGNDRCLAVDLDYRQGFYDYITNLNLIHYRALDFSLSSLEYGYSNGYSNGYDLGFSNGKTQGIIEGQASSNSELSAFSLIGSAFGAVGSFLNFKITPHLTIGILISIPLCITIVICAVKLLKG